jgi:RNA polymerase sigma factor (sigma-70 family)
LNSEETDRIVKSSQKTRGRRGVLAVLFNEFAAYYSRYRCSWSPYNPRRLFSFVIKSLYPYYRRRLGLYEFISVVYQTLGFPGSEPAGLFKTFDRKKYRGDRPIDSHFINFFKTKLRGNLGRFLKRDKGKKRGVDPVVVQPRPWLVLQRASDRPRRETYDVLGALDSLDEQERQIIRLTFWEGYSDRKIAEVVRVDHKTVKAWRERILAKLRVLLLAA